MGYELMDVLEEHLNEAAFHLELWEDDLMSPECDLEAVAVEEERLLAHVDALVVAGPLASEPLLLPALQSKEQSVVAAAALALLGGQEVLGVDQVLRRLRGGSAPERASLGRALELSGRPELNGRLLLLLELQEPLLQARVLEVLGFLRAVSKDLLLKLLRHEAAEVRVAALRGARALPGGVRGGEEIARCLASEDPVIRNAAMEAGLVCGMRAAWSLCRQAVESGGRECWGPMLLLALGGDDKDIELLVQRAEVAETRRPALWALGFSGQVSAAEACLRWMAEAPVAALAAEAFCAITGLVLEGQYRAPDEPEVSGEPPPLEQDDLDADLKPKPEDALPRPAAEEVKRWWQASRGRFSPGVRYLRGRPLDATALLDSLAHEPMRRRHVLARELAIRSRGVCQVQTRALRRRQWADMAAARAAQGALSMLPLAQTLG